MNNRQLDPKTQQHADDIALHLVSKLKATTITLKEESRRENDRFAKAMCAGEIKEAKADVRLVLADLARELAALDYQRGPPSTELIKKAMEALYVMPGDREDLQSLLQKDLQDFRARAEGRCPEQSGFPDEG